MRFVDKKHTCCSTSGDNATHPTAHPTVHITSHPTVHTTAHPTAHTTAHLTTYVTANSTPHPTERTASRSSTHRHSQHPARVTKPWAYIPAPSRVPPPSPFAAAALLQTRATFDPLATPPAHPNVTAAPILLLPPRRTDGDALLGGHSVM